MCETNCSAAKRRAPRTNLTHSTHLTTAQLHSRAIRNSRWPMSAPAARRASPTSPPPATSAPCHWCVHLSIWIPAPGVFTRCVCLSLPLVCARPVVFYLCISLPLVCAHAVVFPLSIYTCIRYGWCNPPPQTKPKPPLPPSSNYNPPPHQNNHIRSPPPTSPAPTTTSSPCCRTKNCPPTRAPSWTRATAASAASTWRRAR